MLLYLFNFNFFMYELKIFYFSEKQFKQAMTPEEKEKLFKAIGYQDDLDPDDYPANFVAVNLKFALHCLEVCLTNYIKNNVILQFFLLCCFLTYEAFKVKFRKFNLLKM